MHVASASAVGTREEVERGILVYTCNCGWLDTSDADARWRQPNVGAEVLWQQIDAETGTASQKVGERGFKVSYSPRTGAETRAYFVKHGLEIAQKESVALGIFLEFSVRSARMHGSNPWSWISMRDSSVSEEELLRDLIGFYVALRPGIDVKALCGPVSRTASLAVWNTYGSVSGDNNGAFNSRLLPCDECRGPGRFHSEFQQIVPAAKGTLFRDWTSAPAPTDINVSNPTGTVDEVVAV